MNTKEITTKSAKVSMFIFMLHFAKINLIVSIKNVFKIFALIGLWILPLVINCNTIYNSKFNMYYMVISVVAMLLGIVIYGAREDMEHAVYLNSREYKLSAYDKLLIKLYSIL